MSEMSNLLGLKPPADIKLGTNTPRAMAKAPKVVSSIDEIDKTAWPREGSGARAAFEFLVQNPGADAVALAEIMNCPKNNVAGGMGFYVQRGLIEVRKDKSRGTWPVSLYYLAGTAPAEENAGTEGPAASASAPSSPVEAVAATPPESSPASQPSEVGSGGATLPAAPPQRPSAEAGMANRAVVIGSPRHPEQTHQYTRQFAFSIDDEGLLQMRTSDTSIVLGLADATALLTFLDKTRSLLQPTQHGEQ